MVFRSVTVSSPATSKMNSNQDQFRFQRPASCYSVSAKVSILTLLQPSPTFPARNFGLPRQLPRVHLDGDHSQSMSQYFILHDRGVVVNVDRFDGY